MLDSLLLLIGPSTEWGKELAWAVKPEDGEREVQEEGQEGKEGGEGIEHWSWDKVCLGCSTLQTFLVHPALVAREAILEGDRVRQSYKRRASGNIDVL